MDENEEFVKLKTDEAKLTQRIESGKKDSIEIAAKLNEHSDEIVKKTGKENEKVARHFSEISTLTIRMSNAIADFSKSALRKTIDSSEFNFWVVTVLFLVTGAVGVYALFGFLQNEAVWFAVIWGGISVWTLLRLHNQNQKLKGYPDVIDTTVSGFINELTDKNANVTLPQTDLSIVKRLVSTLSAAGSEVAAAAVDILPVAGKLIDHQNKRLLRDQFVENFRNAMARYGFPVDDPDIKSILRTRLWLLDNEEDMMKDAIGRLRNIYPYVDESIFRLCYYEFFGKNQLEPLWKRIRNEDDLRGQLATVLVANKAILNGQLNERSIPALNELLSRFSNFSFAEVETRATGFFSKLAEFKVTCNIQLGFYGLRILTLRDSLMDYVPKSSDPETWRDDVLTFIGEKLLNMDPDIIKLLVKDGIGDSGKTSAWKKIVQDKKYVALAKTLAIERTRKQTIEFDDDAFLAHITLCLKSLGDEFSVFKVETIVSEMENTIQRTGKLVHNCAEWYRIETKELEFAKTFVPSSPPAAESEFVEKAAERYNIEPDLLQFLYKTTTDPNKAAEFYAEFIMEHAKSLSELLISRNFVPRGDFAPNVETLLKSQKSFDLSSFIQLASLYEKLSSTLSSLSGFLDIHRIRNNRSIGFNDLIRLCPPNSESSFEAQLVTLVTYLVDSHFERHELDDKKTKELATSATLLFLNLQNDPAFRPLCETVYYMDFGSRVLYRHLIQAEERLESEMVTLREAVDLVMDSTPETPQYLHFEYFQSQLLERKLPRTASSMIAFQIDSIRRDFQRAQENGLERNVIENYLLPISDLLNEKINEEIVKDFLTTKVLSAYLITVPKNFPGIGFLTDESDIIDEAAKKLVIETGDESYTTLYRVDKGTGKSTRIGIVPFGMSFEDFATKFEELFSKAIRLANARPSPTTTYPYPLPYYLVRIFPSEDALREIMRRNDVKTSPFGIVRDMVKEQVGASESISLLSLLQRAGTSNLALKQVIESIIDHPKSNLGTLVEDLISSLLAKFPSGQKRFQRGDVDRQLFQVYDVKTLSSLCTKLTELLRAPNKDAVREAFCENLIKAVPGLDIELGSSNLQILVDALLRRMKGVGTAMKLEL